MRGRGGAGSADEIVTETVDVAMTAVNGRTMTTSAGNARRRIPYQRAPDSIGLRWPTGRGAAWQSAAG
ncbi:MAG: hypothetical protein K8W52_13880 [Deltaproteobacteria bacterium]|nr:hypothetical protein [Deltaproteobacteria bacterium]